ncbi:MAG: ribonuclease III, partial [Kiritimatiellae bacterium]|nr:ribonuclease III [Kiritimatiellia bacterium]
MSQPAQKVDVAAASAALGCSFANPSLLETAFTHQSYAHGRPGDEDNQRLEFLGDAVLGLLAADALYRADPAADEGVLTARRRALVSGAALARLAARLDIARFMRFSPGVRDTVERSGERTSAALVEAVFGAAWLDGGCAAATALFDRRFA